MMTASLHRNDWREERLQEARAVLADISHHPTSLVLLACRVIAAHSADRIEIEDAEKTAALLRSSREERL
jgi:hypothetical protein